MRVEFERSQRLQALASAFAVELWTSVICKATHTAASVTTCSLFGFFASQP